MVRTLSRRGVRNIVLIGEIEVGKTAMLHALAQFIANQRGIPKPLAGKRLAYFDLDSVARKFTESEYGINDEFRDVFEAVADEATGNLIFCFEHTEPYFDIARSGNPGSVSSAFRRTRHRQEPLRKRPRTCLNPTR